MSNSKEWPLVCLAGFLVGLFAGVIVTTFFSIRQHEANVAAMLQHDAGCAEWVEYE